MYSEEKKGKGAHLSSVHLPSSSGWLLTPSGRVVQSSRHRHAPSHDYVVVVTEDGHYLSSHGKDGSSISSLDHDALMAVLRRLLDKLARVHAAGYEAGNATLEHVLVERKTHEPMLDTFSHLSPAGNAVGEVPTLLASFYKLGTLSRQDVRALISHYLDSEAGRRAQAEEYLRVHSGHGPHSASSSHPAAGSHSAHASHPVSGLYHVQHHAAHLPLEDRLLEKFDKRYHMFFAP
jgi:hypothetical protein